MKSAARPQRPRKLHPSQQGLGYATPVGESLVAPQNQQQSGPQIATSLSAQMASSLNEGMKPS